MENYFNVLEQVIEEMRKVSEILAKINDDYEVMNHHSRQIEQLLNIK